MPLIVSKQVVNMVEIRIELPKLKILTSTVTSEDPPISTQSTFDFPYFPLLSPFFFSMAKFPMAFPMASPALPAPPGQRSSSELAVQEAILMSLMSPADTVPMALGFNRTDDGDEIEGNLWKSTYMDIYIYNIYYIIYMWKSCYFTGIYKPRSGGHHGKHLELRIEKQ